MTVNSALRPVLIPIYVVIFIVSLLAAFGMAHGFSNFSQWFVPLFLPVLPAALIVKLVVFGKRGLYRGQQASFRDVFAATWISALVMLVLFFLAGNVLSGKFVVAKYRQGFFLWDWLFTAILTWLVQKLMPGSSPPEERTAEAREDGVSHEEEKRI